ncbi:MAG: heparinase II/III family protein [Ferruginibacter sp.]|nr:heparinase II/III family protein [Ferruginibacter sp.]
MKALKHLMTALAFIFYFSPTWAQEQIATTWPTSSCLTESSWQKMPSHPRLFATSKRWNDLKSQLKKDTVSQKLFSLVKERAENVLQLPLLGLATKTASHGTARQIQGRIAGLSMTYKITGDKRFLDRVVNEMSDLASSPGWNPAHFLTCSEATVAMSIGLDWLYDDLTIDQRKLFANAIIEKALKISLLNENNLNNWSESGGNWGSVCNGGMAIGALTVKEYAPELAKKVVNRSLANIHFAGDNYAPAGAHSEGPGYWAYGTTFYVLFAEALRGSFGTSCSIENATGFLRSGEYILQLMAPSDDMFSFADSEPFWGFEPVMFWFAKELKQIDMAEPLFKRLAPMHSYLVSDNAKADASRIQPLGLLWWNPELLNKKAAPRKLNWWSEGGSQPQAVMRSAWNDKNATFVGIKAGKAGISHGHMDVGSFILEAKGIRWAVDLGRDGYTLPRQHGLGNDLFLPTQESKRWAIFCNGAESHNIIRFNGAPQWIEGKADLVPTTNKAVSPGYKMDLTPVYAGQVVSAQRGFNLRSDKSMLIQDEWETGERGTAITWQWLTYAKVELKANQVLLSQSNESLQLLVVSKDVIHLSVQDVGSPQNVWDAAHPGLKRITIRINAPAKQLGRIAIIADPSLKAEHDAPELLLPLNEW